MGRPDGRRRGGERRAVPADPGRPRRRRQLRGPVVGRGRRRDRAPTPDRGRDPAGLLARRRRRRPTRRSSAGRRTSRRGRRSGSTTAPSSSGRSPPAARRGGAVRWDGRLERGCEGPRRDLPGPDRRRGRRRQPAAAVVGLRIDRTAGWLRWTPAAFYPQDLDGLAKTARASFRLTRAARTTLHDRGRQGRPVVRTVWSNRLAGRRDDPLDVGRAGRGEGDGPAGHVRPGPDRDERRRDDDPARADRRRRVRRRPAPATGSRPAGP